MAEPVRVHYQGSRVPGAGIAVIVEDGKQLSAYFFNPPYEPDEVEAKRDELLARFRQAAD